MDAFKVIEKRNLIVLGRTGVGKSTVVNQILGKTVFTAAKSRERRTSEKETETEIRDAEEKVAYKIKIIDTVGLRDDAEQRGKEVVDEIQDYLSRKAPEGVNLFLFVMRKGPLSKDEREVFQKIIERCEKKVKKLSTSVITCCEGRNKDGRREIVFEIRNGEGTEELAEFMGRDICPVGFPGTDEAKKADYEEAIRKDAEELRSVVLSSGMMILPQDVFKNESSSCLIQSLI